MRADHFDLVALGSGSAARDAAGKAAREFDARVALIEHRLWGGSCPNVACRPTKAYVVAAELAHDIRRHAAERGIDVSAPHVELARTRAWKDTVLRDQKSWSKLLSDQGYETVRGTGMLVDSSTIRVGDREVTAERILIATGSRTAVPPIPGIDEIEWLDHITALELDEVPKSMLVVGGGPVGLEFAQIFRRFGTKVTIVNHGSQIAARADAEAAEELRAALEAEDIEIVVNDSVASLARAGAGIEAAVGNRTMTVSHVLLASGRAANTEGLNLDRVGVDTARGRIAVDQRQRTSSEGIWAAGDVAVGPMLTPIAQYQSRIAIDDMFGDGLRTADYSALPTAIFTDPELADVGLTESQAQAEGYDVEVVKHPLSAVTRAQYIGAKHGLFKIVFERSTRRVLGVHVVSRGASDIVGALAPSLKLGATIDDLALMHHIYPSHSEGLKAAAEQAL